ncbi:MAG: hypothetical protein ACOCV2_09575 [Persicimonas sp.]
MSDTEQRDGEEVVDSSEVDDLEQFDEGDESSDRLGFWILGVVLLLGVLTIGVLAHYTGMGWFGYRTILYGSGDIYLLNMSDEPLEATVDGEEPIAIDPEGAHAIEVVGGERSVTVRDEEGEVVEEHELFVDDTDALVKLSPDGCLAVSDIGAFYGRGGEDLEIVDKIDEDKMVYLAGTHNIVWPRQSFPRELADGDGDALWIELVGCSLLEEEDFLRAYLDARLGHRLEGE